MKKKLRNNKIIFLEILLSLLLIWSYFYPWAYNYSWEVVGLLNPLIACSLLFILIVSTVLAMIDKNNFILISNLLIVLFGVILATFINQYLQQFLP